MQVPKRLSDYPWVIVNISCKLCARRGRYRLARLAVRYGSEQTLDGLLADLAHTCPYWRTNPRNYEPRCGARFEDLDRLRPHDVPGAPRERPPSRESLPQRRPRSPPVPGQGPVLSSWEHETIALVCGKCGRREAYEVTAMIATMGDVPLTTVHTTLTAACPRAVKQDFSDWCGARFDAG